jgi:hypothetical protein
LRLGRRGRQLRRRNVDRFIRAEELDQPPLPSGSVTWIRAVFADVVGQISTGYITSV